jgi:adenylosuccinate synthase
VQHCLVGSEMCIRDRYLAGWTEDISGARKMSDLPKNAQDYVAFLEKISGAPMSAIGVGPGRDQTIVVKDFI